MKADLHTHTTASDGRENPERLVDLALEKGLTSLAITDHDTLDGYQKAKPTTCSADPLVARKRF